MAPFDLSHMNPACANAHMELPGAEHKMEPYDSVIKLRILMEFISKS